LDRLGGCASSTSFNLLLSALENQRHELSDQRHRMDATIGTWMINLPRASVIPRANLAIPRVSVARFGRYLPRRASVCGSDLAPAPPAPGLFF
jgi:hypothetical protein